MVWCYVMVKYNIMTSYKTKHYNSAGPIWPKLYLLTVIFLWSDIYTILYIYWLLWTRNTQFILISILYAPLVDKALAWQGTMLWHGLNPSEWLAFFGEILHETAIEMALINNLWGLFAARQVDDQGVASYSTGRPVRHTQHTPLQKKKAAK